MTIIIGSTVVLPCKINETGKDWMQTVIRAILSPCQRKHTIPIVICLLQSKRVTCLLGSMALLCSRLAKWKWRVIRAYDWCHRSKGSSTHPAVHRNPTATIWKFKMYEWPMPVTMPAKLAPSYPRKLFTASRFWVSCLCQLANHTFFRAEVHVNEHQML